jgi:hypothetical protein
VANNIINVNVGTPGVRFGGLSVYDSGSQAGATGSLFWDSQNNNWVYQQVTGSTYTGGMLISGPRNTGGLGNEAGTTNNAVMKGMGGDHITSSAMFEVSGSVTMGTALTNLHSITGSVSITGSLLVGGGLILSGSALSVYNNSGTPYISVASGTGSIAYMQAVNNTEVQFGDLSNNNSTISLYTGGTRRVFISGSGGVGIGITTPRTRFQVVGLTGGVVGGATGIATLGLPNSSSVALFTNLDPDYGTLFGTLNTGVGWIQQQRVDGTATAYNLLLQPNGGAVGIGVTSPNHTLAVNGAVGFYSTTPTQKWHIQYNATADGLNFVESAVADYRMFIKAGGNVGIGNSSPNTNLSVKGSASNPTSLTYNGMFGLESAGQTSFQMGIGSSFNGTWFQSYNQPAGGAGNFALLLNPLGGGVGIGTTSLNYIVDIVTGANNSLLYLNQSNGAVGGNAALIANINTTGGYLVLWRYGGTTIGSITTNGSATAYNTTSDYRLKEDLNDFNGLEKISAIKVYDFKWKGKNDRQNGVIAHELAEVLPYAVNGEKDQLDKDGNVNPQGVDYSMIVPSLVKAIQELKAEIDELKNK